MRSDVLNNSSGSFDASVGGFQEITATMSLTQADSGKIFALNSTSAVVVTLPTDANCDIGCTYKFIVQTTNDNAYTIKTGDDADSGGDDFVGGVILASTTAGFGHAVLAAANDYEIVLDGNLADTGGEKGSWIEVVKITADEWMVSGCVYSDDADTDGTALFTNS
tara:strand:+ start:6599 stop:7093 length:495 start_codon:yes stop_codon:yes gene_type:complete